MKDGRWSFEYGQGPIVATAIHNGHQIRPEVLRSLVLQPHDCLREEDPFTGRLAEIASNRIVLNRSRFEVDLNRPRKKAVYKTPEDAWGLDLWKEPLQTDVIQRSLEIYDSFYGQAYQYFKKIEGMYGKFVVLDLHSYCHRRNGPDAECDPSEKNPDINIGTANMDRVLWSGLVDRFITDMSCCRVSGEWLDVRENVKFKGGYFSRWIHENFPQSGCCLAVEVKKIFMDEWTGKLNETAFEEITKAFEFALPGLIKELNVTV